MTFFFQLYISEKVKVSSSMVSGNYRKEADDLHSVVLYLQKNYDITAVVGHSKG
jgi:hypothetical protein